MTPSSPSQPLPGDCSRRRFLAHLACVAGFSGLSMAMQRLTAAEAGGDPLPAAAFGALVADPRGILDLPAGFSYQIIGKVGQAMDDGLVLPGAPDGMATFAGPDGSTIVVRNHEINPGHGGGPFGHADKFLDRVPREKIYDDGAGASPAQGGTTTFIYDTAGKRLLGQYLSLAGTMRNCAGGPTPWGSWITCEEVVLGKGPYKGGVAARDHGWCFEVPAQVEPALADPVPLTALGRFNHEAIAVDPASGIVYLTEDRVDGLIYRCIPTTPGALRDGGRLQALVLREVPKADTRNWPGQTGPTAGPWAVGQQIAVEWVDLDQIESPDDDLRLRGHQAGAALFARGEGMWMGEGEVWFACTSGGPVAKGQIWRLRPDADAGDRLELFWQATDKRGPMSVDNLSIAPDGSVLVCEDRQDADVRLVHFDAAGRPTIFARNHLKTEFAGVCVSPDGSTVFVNIQGAGLTVAIDGPWPWRA